MKLKTLLGLVVVTCLLTLGAFAQESTTEKSKDATRTVTGCLTRGGGANEYTLTTSDGSTWEVHSSQLADHVGHTVSLTGVVKHNKMHNMKEDAKDAAKDSGMKKSDTEHGHMTVTDVQMVSSSCQQ